ncbi:hypothetical protein [Arthrobacter sp.]|uniref:hypothetical protein n=1 Tax=Arthrobacter sp. TaxID=1667 RepID=UPI002810C052|nr:hypothetical protein [Arthrobacter sp.]
MSEHQDDGQGFVVPDPSAVREDIPGDSGDEANVVRFSEEQALIEEQAGGVQPERYDVPSGEPGMDEARGDLDLPDRTGSSTADDSSDDPMHGGAME